MPRNSSYFIRKGTITAQTIPLPHATPAPQHKNITASIAKKIVKGNNLEQRHPSSKRSCLTLLNLFNAIFF